jgi:hypothetical protein
MGSNNKKVETIASITTSFKHNQQSKQHHIYRQEKHKQQQKKHQAKSISTVAVQAIAQTITSSSRKTA